MELLVLVTVLARSFGYMDTQMSNNQHRYGGWAASGLGEASARLFVANGAKVVIADIQDEKGTKVATELGYENARCLVTTEMPLVQKPSSFKISSSQTSES
ncbi:unnamed protein product [Sphagnum tenellum]